MFELLSTHSLYFGIFGAVYLNTSPSLNKTVFFRIRELYVTHAEQFPIAFSWAIWFCVCYSLCLWSSGSIFPRIVDSCGDHFGSTLPDLLGSAIPIRSVLADQSASVFGSGICCSIFLALKISYLSLLEPYFKPQVAVSLSWQYDWIIFYLYLRSRLLWAGKCKDHPRNWLLFR